MMRPLITVVAAFLVCNAQLVAQTLRRGHQAQLVLEGTAWQLNVDRAFSSAARFGPTARFIVHPGEPGRLIFYSSAFYSREDPNTGAPGVMAIQLGFGATLLPYSARPRANVTVTAGYGALHLAAGASQAMWAQLQPYRCGVAPAGTGCWFENATIYYQTGWTGGVALGAAFDLPVGAAFSGRLEANLLSVPGSTGWGNEGRHGSLGLGVAWRP